MDYDEFYTALKSVESPWTEKLQVAYKLLDCPENVFPERHQFLVEVLTNAIAPKSKTSVAITSPDCGDIWRGLCFVLQEAPSTVTFKSSIIQSIQKVFESDNKNILGHVFAVVEYLVDEKNGHSELLIQNYKNIMDLTLWCIRLKKISRIPKPMYSLVAKIFETANCLCSAKTTGKQLLQLVCKDYLQHAVKFLYKIKNLDVDVPFEAPLLQFLKVNLFRKSLGDLYGLAMSPVGDSSAPVTMKLFETVEHICQIENDKLFTKFSLETLCGLFVEAYGERKDRVAFVIKMESVINNDNDYDVITAMATVIDEHKLYKASLDSNQEQLKYLKQKFDLVMDFGTSRAVENEIEPTVLDCASHFIAVDTRIIADKLPTLVQIAVTNADSRCSGVELLCRCMEVYCRQRQLDVFMSGFVDKLALHGRHFALHSEKPLVQVLTTNFELAPLGQMNNVALSIMNKIEKFDDLDPQSCSSLCFLFRLIIQSVNLFKAPKISGLLSSEAVHLGQKMSESGKKLKSSHCLLADCVYKWIMLQYCYSVKGDDDAVCRFESVQPCSKSLCQISALVCELTIKGNSMEQTEISSKITNIIDKLPSDLDYFLQVAWPVFSLHLDESSVEKISEIFCGKCFGAEQSCIEDLLVNPLSWECPNMRRILVGAIYNVVKKIWDSWENTWMPMGHNDDNPCDLIKPGLLKSVCKGLWKIKKKVGLHHGEVPKATQLQWRRLMFNGINRMDVMEMDDISTSQKFVQLLRLFDPVPFEYLEPHLKLRFAACATLFIVPVKVYFQIKDQNLLLLLKNIFSDVVICAALKNVDIETVWKFATMFLEEGDEVLSGVCDTFLTCGDFTGFGHLVGRLLNYVCEESTKIPVKLLIIKVILEKVTLFAKKQPATSRSELESVISSCDLILFQILQVDLKSQTQDVSNVLFPTAAALYKSKAAMKDRNPYRMDIALPSLINKATQIAQQSDQALQFLSDVKSVRILNPAFHCTPQTIQQLMCSDFKTAPSVQTMAGLIFAAPMTVIKECVNMQMKFEGRLLFWTGVLYHCSSHTVAEDWTVIIKDHLPQFFLQIAEHVNDSDIIVERTLNLCQLLVQNRCRKLVPEKLQNILSMVFCVIAAIDWQLLIDQKRFRSVFHTCCMIVNDSLVQYSAVTVIMAAAVQSIVSNLVAELCKFSKRIQEDDCDVVSQCCYSLYKLCALFGQHKRDFERIVPYLISDLLNAIQSGQFSSRQKKLIVNSVYKLLDLCDKYSIAFLSTNMSPSLVAIFKVYYEEYLKFHKYKGGV